MKPNLLCNWRFAFAISAVLIVLAGCGAGQKATEIQTLLPEADPAVEVAVSAPDSYINLPVRIDIKGLSEVLNNNLEGLIYHDSIIEDDDVKMKVWKEAPIELSVHQKKIKSILPLRAVITYRLGTDKLGIPLYNDRELFLNGIVTLESSALLTRWTIKTNTRIQSLVWKENPSIKVLGQNISVANLVNPAVGLFKKTIERQIDQSLQEVLDFKPQVTEAVNALSKPFLLSETFESHLWVKPEELYVTDSDFDEQTLFFSMGLKAKISTILGKAPENIDNSKWKLVPVKEIPNRVDMAILVTSTYEEAARLMKKNFQGEIFGEGKKQVRITDVAIWQKGGKLIVALTLSGSVKGNIYLNGYPQFNATTEEVYFDQLDYVLDTRNVLLNSANWLASNKMLIAFQQLCRYSMAEQIAELKKNIDDFTQHYPITEGVFLEGEMETFDFLKFELGSRALYAHLMIKGKLGIVLESRSGE